MNNNSSLAFFEKHSFQNLSSIYGGNDDVTDKGKIKIPGGNDQEEVEED
jgi:hypothetical protein